MLIYHAFPKYQLCSIERFVSLTLPLFEQFPFLNKSGEDIDEVFENWKKYKYSVPVYGAILLNQNLDKVMLVKLGQGDLLLDI